MKVRTLPRGEATIRNGTLPLRLTFMSSYWLYAVPLTVPLFTVPTTILSITRLYLRGCIGAEDSGRTGKLPRSSDKTQLLKSYVQLVQVLN